MAQPTSATTPITAAADKPRKFQLEAEHELRFEIPADLSGVTLVLENGSAELFGIELAHNRSYPLQPGLNAAVFTWHGATVLLSVVKAKQNALDLLTSSTGDNEATAHKHNNHSNTADIITNPESSSNADDNSSFSISSVMAYTATNTPMPSYINAHAVLQSKRLVAKTKGLPGPRAMVVGSKDCGKTTLVNTLSAYGIKANGSAMMVDLDPSSTGVAGTMPGSITFSIAKHIDIDKGGVIHDNTVSFMLGHTLPGQNESVSKVVFGAMNNLLDRMFIENISTTHKSLHSYNGCIIDTSNDIDDKNGINTLIESIKILKVNVVFVLGSERLFASIRRTFDSNKLTEVVLLNKSGGVVSRDDSVKLSLQSTKVRQYFYGIDNIFNPYSSVMEIDKIKVFKVGGVISQLADSLLPIGAESSIDPLKPVVITSLHDLLHKVLGVSQAEKEEDVVTSPLFGYLHVVSVNPSKNTMIVLAPSTGAIPGKYFVMGDIKWIE